MVEPNGDLGWFARSAAGYGKLKQKLPFNPFPLIYLIRKYIVANCLSASKLGAFTNMVNCNKVSMSDANPFVKDYGHNGRVDDGYGEVDENYLFFSRAGDRLTITFWMSNKRMDALDADSSAKKVRCVYTIPAVPSDSDKDKSVRIFDKGGWEKPDFVGGELHYNIDSNLFE